MKIFIEKQINNFFGLFNSELKRVLPRKSMLFAKGYFKGKEVIGVEIGSLKGINSKSIIKTLNVKKLYLVDPYLDYDGYTDDNGKDKMNKHMSDCINRLKGLEDKYELIRDYSANAAKKIPNNLDFVYIDGNHTYPFVKEDIDLYYPKVKDGGIIAGHDMENGKPSDEHDGVTKAVIEFAVKNKLKLYIQSPDWWIVKGNTW